MDRPEKPRVVLARDAEWGVLSDLWASEQPELAFVVGRRRVGKSVLLARFARAVGGVYYQATRRTDAEQLAGISRTLGERFDDAALRRGVSFPDWESVFGYVAEQSERRAGVLLLVLDEFPYLSEASPALPSEVQRAWDHRWSGSRMKVVLSGSYVTAMERLDGADQPLYGRRTAKLTLRPFEASEASAFVPGWSAREVLQAYGEFGHLPGHLALLDAGRTLAENAAVHVLHPSGRLPDDAQHTLDVYLGEASVYYAVVEAIARGAETWKEITSRMGRSGGGLLRPLQWLDEMGLVERSVPVTEARPDRSRRVRYRLRDPYLALWHRVVSPLVDAGSLGLAPPAALWAERLVPALDDHMGSVFEAAARGYVRGAAGGGAQGGLPFRPFRVGSWWSSDGRVEVDVVAVGGGGELLVGEAKWGAVTGRHLETLRRRAALVAAEAGGAPSVHLALFSGRGEADEAVRSAAARGEVLVVAPDAVVWGGRRRGVPTGVAGSRACSCSAVRRRARRASARGVWRVWPGVWRR